MNAIEKLRFKETLFYVTLLILVTLHKSILIFTLSIVKNDTKCRNVKYLIEIFNDYLQKIDYNLNIII